MTLAQRVKLRREQLELSQPKLSALLGEGVASQQAIAAIENGQTKRPRYIRELARALQCSEDWLLGTQGSEGIDLSPPDTYKHPVVAQSAYEDFALLPVYDARASAGAGAINDDGEPVCYSAFRHDWLRRVTNAPTDKLAVIQVAGDSMEPTLHNSDHVLIDLSVNRCSRDGLYVIRYDDTDEVQVKRLLRDPNTRTLTVKSDNPSYPTSGGIRDDSLAVIGRVLWLGRNVG